MSKFIIKDKIDKSLYTCFNLFSDIFFNLNLNSKSIIKDNEKFKNAYEGERCFILGTGPSLANISLRDIELLSKEKTFAVNSFYKASQFDLINPMFYCLMDNLYWGVSSGVFGEISEKYNNSNPIFITDIRAKSFIPESLQSIFLYAKHYPTRDMRFDISKNLSITMNVVSFAILAAIYMGFKEIYLLGCDYNLFCSRQKNHCYDDHEEHTKLPTYNLGFYLKYYHLTTEFHYLIAKLSKKSNIKILNITENSLLDAYPLGSISTLHHK